MKAIAFLILLENTESDRCNQKQTAKKSIILRRQLGLFWNHYRFVLSCETWLLIYCRDQNV
ncbi:MAG: hypothetical protein DCF25_16105 [Leptolyngbya foveolarum]|uniref:Uncharacterized protein n=1 Tax=Leptolyngbya foveolarum TaxID=47253 RepID=A0A2W4TX44_9CYAN|nr:MAG: hypothetical protein DCF25_16105 [Leptolyngbya foveolarum]